MNKTISTLIPLLLLPGLGLSQVSGERSKHEPFETPVALYLTWQQDPTTTMTIHRVSEGAEDESWVDYRPWNEEEAAGRSWESVTGSSEPMARFSNLPVHTVELTGLEPATTYQFRVPEGPGTFKFRTLPADADEPIRFAAGGDTMHRQIWMERVNRVAMEYEPEFIVWGGDLAYADGRENRRGLHRWFDWFDAIKNTMITEEGRVIPIVVTMGNHEMRGGYYFHHDDFEQTDDWRREVAPYFYTLFSMPGQPGYNVLDFGDYLSLVVLDSDHTNPVEGEQTEWLEEILAERQEVPHVFPVYHVPGYPGVRDFDGDVSTGIRKHWVPLFEQYGVRVAFENHDHAYKRTVPIRDGEAADDGIVYIGDGSWGTSARSVHDADETWYLERSESVRHFILATIHGDDASFKMIDEFGEKIDEYELPADD